MRNSWKQLFSENQIEQQIANLIRQAYQDSQIVYPLQEDVLNLFKLVDVKDIKVVIIGQDPYHNPFQANGIAFSTNTTKTPPSLLNIFKELQADLNINHFNNNDLSGWVKQGVLLINTTWTVVENQPASHAKIGWKLIVIAILDLLNQYNSQLVYCLWGKHAQQIFQQLKFRPVNCISSSHPSPFSYHQGFKGSKPFSKINHLLNKIEQESIDWSK